MFSQLGASLGVSKENYMFCYPKLAGITSRYKNH